MYELILLMASIIFIGIPFLAVLSACIVASRVDRKEEAARIQSKINSPTPCPERTNTMPRGLTWRVDEPGV